MTEKVIMSRDVTFDERGVWDWSTENPKIVEVALNYQQNEDNYYIQPSSVTQDPQIELITHLKTCKLHRYIESTLAPDVNEDDKAKDNLALSQIHQAIDISIFEKIVTANMANEVWIILDKTYKGIERVLRNNLMILK